MKKYLLLGGTGAMGIHLCSLLADENTQVFVTSRRSLQSTIPNIIFIQGNAKDPGFLRALLKREHWDAIVDFMIWDVDEFIDRSDLFLASTDQYCFTSSYRVYSSTPLISESSPRLLDTIEDEEYLATNEYALAKARCEDVLFQSEHNNWTIVRPAITYDGSGRFQLGVYEAIEWLPRACHGIPVPFPEEMLSMRTTMSWGGDVAKMISMLLGNQHAYGEVFTVSTCECATWNQVCHYYSKIIPLRICPCSIEEFDRLYPRRKYQIHYDRMFDRVVDNSKILRTTGLQQADFVSLEDGLIRELGFHLESQKRQEVRPGMQGRFDRLVGGFPSIKWVTDKTSLVGVMQYLVRRLLYSPAI